MAFFACGRVLLLHDTTYRRDNAIERLFRATCRVCHGDAQRVGPPAVPGDACVIPQRDGTVVEEGIEKLSKAA
jgi:hypothetical protein